MDKIRELQLCELDILKKIKYICDKNNLKYYLIGGTLLGAVRHKGYIPWDDDTDIVMPRPDYTHFIVLAKEYFNAFPYKVLTSEDDPNYTAPFVKIINKNMRVKVNFNLEEQIWYAWVDVFPLDSMPDKSLYFFIRKFQIIFRKKILTISSLSKSVLKEKKRNVFEKYLIRFLSFINIEKYINSHKQIVKYNKLLSSYSYDKGKYLINMMERYGFKSIVERDVFGEGKYLIFEDEKFRVPEKYDKYLEKVYGDYMKLPPLDKRNDHLTTIL